MSTRVRRLPGRAGAEAQAQAAGVDDRAARPEPAGTGSGRTSALPPYVVPSSADGSPGGTWLGNRWSGVAGAEDAELVAFGVGEDGPATRRGWPTSTRRAPRASSRAISASRSWLVCGAKSMCRRFFTVLPSGNGTKTMPRPDPLPRGVPHHRLVHPARNVHALVVGLDDRLPAERLRPPGGLLAHIQAVDHGRVPPKHHEGPSSSSGRTPCHRRRQKRRSGPWAGDLREGLLGG